MASLVARAALPSGPARRLGSQRLPLADLAGHGAVVLAGRGSRQAPGRDVKVACAKDGVDPPSMGDQDEFFEKMYRIRSEQFDNFLGLYIPLPNALPMSKEEKAVQEKLKEIAEKCITLVHDAMRRLPCTESRRLGNILWQARNAFAIVRSRATVGHASIGMAVVIAEKLYMVLKTVSCGCSTPLPLDMKSANKLIIPFTAPVFPIDHGVEVLVFHIIDNLYNAVKSDINAMIRDDASRA